MKKRILAMLLTLCMALSLLPMSALAAEVTGLSGSGTADDPVIIGTVDELKFFRDQVNSGVNYENKTVKLNADINLDGIEWTPIGNDTNYFMGTFDGGNKTISNMTIDIESDNNVFAGLFGGIKKATVKNLTMENVNIDVVGAKVRAAAVVGIAHSNSENRTDATINFENITVYGCTINAEAKSGSALVGGVVGYSYPANMKNIAVSDLTINAKAEGNEVRAAAINGYVCGQNISSNGNTRATMLVDTFNVQNVSITADAYTVFAGGYAPYTYYGYITLKNGTINGLKMDVDAHEAFVGGLVGYFWRSDNGHTVKDVAITGIDFDVTTDYLGETRIGGVVGTSQSPRTTYTDVSVSGKIVERCSDAANPVNHHAKVGGFVARTYEYAQQTYTNCVADVDVTGSNIAGGFVGNHNSTVSYVNCEAKGDVTATTAGGFAGRLTEHGYTTDVTFDGCKASGVVTGTNVAGGFIGSTANHGWAAWAAGNGTPYGKNITLKNCVASENVTVTGGTEYCAGVVGEAKVADGKNITLDNVSYKVEPAYYPTAASVKTMVAKVGEISYETLAKAIEAADAGDTITLLADVTENVTVDKSVTIDGANFEYTGNISVSGNTTEATVKNVNFVDYTDNYAITTNRIKSITVENCTLNGYDGFLYANKSTPTVAVKNVTMNGGIYGMHWVYGTEATLENVTMTDVTNGLLIQNYAGKTIKVKNCNISSIAIWERSGSSGVQTFRFEGANTVGTLSASQYAKYVLAADATLTAPEGAPVTTDVQYHKVVYADGVYSVVADYAAQIGETCYGTLQAAIDAAKNGDTIVLLKDIDLAKTDLQTLDDGYDTYFLVEGKSVTIDLNGKTISGEYTGSMLVGVFSTDNNGKLTLTGNGTVDVTATGNVYSLIVAYNDGSSITIENGTYKLDKAYDNLIYYGGYTDKAVTVKGGTFTLGNVGAGENGKPWIFNVLGAGDHHVYITGGTFNANINRQHWSNEAVVAKECYVTSKDNTWTVNPGAVAYVNTGMTTGPYYAPKDVGYATFEEAVTAAVNYKDGPVTLLADVALTNAVDATGEELVEIVQGTFAIKLAAQEATLTAHEGLNVTSGVEGYKVVYENGVYKLVKTPSNSGGPTRYAVTVDETDNGTVTVSPKSASKGTTVTITATPDAGYELAHLVVVDKDGNSVEVTANANGTYSFKMPASKVTVQAGFSKIVTDCPSEKFIDVDQSLWYHEGIDYAIANGLMNGVADNLFAPNDTTNRAMIVTILYRLEGEPKAADSAFADVADGQWYTDAVAWAAANGIVTGYDADTFGPLDPITREQMAAILYRYADYKGYDVSVGEDTNILSYTDAESVSAYAVSAMQWAVGSDLINGMDGKLAPQGSATRAQVATILMRFCENIVK